MTDNNFVFLFIHGSWHGGWCFEHKLIPLFKNKNYKTITFDLPTEDDIENVCLESYVQKTLDIINKNVGKNEKIILVGHSFGGVTTTLVAEKIASKIQCIIYLSAYYLKDGQSAADINLKNKVGYVTEDFKYICIKDENIKLGLYMIVLMMK